MGWIVAVVIIFFWVSACLNVLREYERAVVFRLGRLQKPDKGPGLIFILWPIDKLVRVSLRVVAWDMPPQDIITRDNVSLKVNAVVYFRVISAQQAYVELENYRYAVEQTLRHRRPVAVMIDEAQHLAKVASGRRLLDQLDVIKSIANRTDTVHVLFGTYDLLAFRNLNGQLSRRSVDVHFPRYCAEVAEERKTVCVRGTTG